MRLTELVDYLNELLEPARFSDYAPNGLQVQGRDEVGRLVGGVSASLELLEAALDEGADAVIVHHGYFWKNEDPRVVGIMRRRLRLLLANEISLLAYHLPLDAHPEYGNNAQLARLLDIDVHGPVDAGGVPGLVLRGRLRAPMAADDFARHIGRRLARAPLHVPGGKPGIETVAWCTGAAQDYIEAAARAGVDAYVTGEASERTTHVAREAGIHFFAAGHHATERCGVQALGRHVSARFGIDFRFVDIDNPV